MQIINGVQDKPPDGQMLRLDVGQREVASGLQPAGTGGRVTSDDTLLRPSV